MKMRAFVAVATAAICITAAAEESQVRLITVDPGHFHAALVQKFMLPGVSPEVRVYAPASDDLAEHMKRIEGFNRRADQPTQWRTQLYTEADYLDRAVKDTLLMHSHPGMAAREARSRVVVLSGNNARKTEYITRFVTAGMHVLADKPMVITPADFEELQLAFATAKKNDVLLYDIMTERFEITTMLQRALSRDRRLFGELERGSVEDPALTKVSVHHFSKVVAGAQLKRPQWFFDPAQQGAGIVDVTTHLVDLVQWEAFPGVTLQPADAKVLKARRWPTPLSREQFARVTGATEFPAFLAPYVKDGVLQAPANGEFTYALKGVHARVSVEWAFEAPAGAGDTHFSVMRGTRASLTIKQGAEQNYKPVLYVERKPDVKAADHENALRAAVDALQAEFPGIGLERSDEGFAVTVPAKYHNGHEAHFTQVTENFLKYLRAGKLPEWEVPNMLTKYSTIMQAYEMSR